MATGDREHSSIDGQLPLTQDCVGMTDCNGSSCATVTAELSNELQILRNRIDQLASLEQFRSDGERIQSNLQDIRTNWSEHCAAWRIGRDQQNSYLASIEHRLQSLESDTALLAKRQSQLEQELHQVRSQQAGLLASLSVLENHVANCPQQFSQSNTAATSANDAEIINNLRARLNHLENFMREQQQQQQQTNGKTSIRHRQRRRHRSPPTTTTTTTSGDLSSDEDFVNNGVWQSRQASSTSSGWSEESLHGLD